MIRKSNINDAKDIVRVNVIGRKNTYRFNKSEIKIIHLVTIYC